MIRLTLLFILISHYVFSQSYAPAAGENGSTAIHFSDSRFVSWAAQINVTRGFVNIEDTTIEALGDNRASFGDPSLALGPGTSDASDVVSLGDKGVATLIFDRPIFNGSGPDFAIFENSFSDTYLEFAHVEVSSNGEDFVRFASHSEVQFDVQIHGFGMTDPRMINNLAGKYRGGYGTPFDLEELIDSAQVDINNITHIRIIDVVGSIGDSATFDSFGNKINEPYSTPYESGGFDLEAVGAINQLLSVEEEDIKSSFSIFPNPTNSSLTVENNGKTFTLHVYDSQGKCVLRESNKTQSIVSLRPGMYYFKVISNNNSIINKVIFN